MAKIKLDNIISAITENDFHTMREIVTIIIKDDNGDFFYIKDELDKIHDVSIMPDYIKNDWIKYNQKDINLTVLNKHVKYYQDKLSNHPSIRQVRPTINKIIEDDYIEKLNDLKLIRRDLIIKGIL